ncbi:MAG TPA: AAA family ATPase [Phycisphaerae bacterium]|nr:AAA family ATPase [Phycisphaerae bacterium]
MRITRVHIKHFRCIADEAIEFQDLTALVGPNGSGKSAVLRAIRAFYETTFSLTGEDFYNRDAASPIEVAVTFGDLTDEEKTLFAPYVDGHTLTVTKVIQGASQKYHGTRLQHLGFAPVRAIESKSDRRTSYNDLRQQEPYSSLPAVKNADQIEDAFRAWELAHPDQREMLPDDGQFFGFRQVGQARLERFTRFVFVPAIRDAEEEAADARGSAIFQLMELVVRSVLAQSKAFDEFRKRTQGQYAELIDSKNVPQLGQLAGQLTQVLKQYVPSAAVVLDWIAADELKLPLPEAKARLEEDGFTASVDRVGHGLQRAFILSLLQSLVVAQAAQSQQTDKREEQSGKPVEQMPDLILAIEEPCLYQHPNRQRHLAKVLLSLSEGRIHGVARRTQVLYCTHSPLFVDLARFDRVRRLSKAPNPGGDNLPLVTRVCSNSLATVAANLQAVQDTLPAKPFTAESVMGRMATLMTPWTNEGFFADVAVLVEGEDDRSAVIGAALQMGVDLEQIGVSVIPCIGKANIDRLYLAFAGLGIPTYIVFDGDKTKHEGDKANRILQRLVGVAKPDDFPATSVTGRYAVFEDDLDVLFRNLLGEELLNTTAKAFMQEHGYRDQASCRKSPQFIKALLAKAAAQGIAVKELEQIVTNVVALVPKPPATLRSS